ncbi:MAG TPA: CopD family protein [Gemmatimonadaceae bacterium]
MMLAEPLLTWSDPPRELVGFIGAFLAAGAIGFRYSALRGRVASGDHAFYVEAARRAALIGLVGALLTIGLAVYGLPSLAARRHTTAVALLTGDKQTMIQFVCLGLAFIGFAIAGARAQAGWIIAAIGVIVGSLRAALFGQWARLVNPIHVLAAGLWIGTLFVLVAAGISALFRREQDAEHRGPITADMVNSFSPLALVAGGVVVLFGLITAWRHLHTLPNLWLTPYGWTLLVKLAFVATVFALGAWNWRRQRPSLGSHEAAASIRKSATAELVVAAVVLVITSVLVSLPSPRG